ncbi:MAG: ABC transporter ATP-binding protein [Planctomycetes bacterium]|nr:ABC transporter ATP-binding protein [Planctomycetota bacterium]
MPRAMLALDHVRKSYGAVPALSDVSLSVAPGTCTVLIGPSGGGKTTLLRCVAGLEEPDGGSVRWGEECWSSSSGPERTPLPALPPAGGGEQQNSPPPPWGRGRRVPVPPERRGAGMVFQHGALWPQKTARQHLELVLSVRVKDRSACIAKVAEWLERVGLTALADRYPDALSGGERQRLALARACAPSPRVLLLDEPLTGLDPASAERLTSLIVDTRKALGCAAIWVTHAQEAALPPCDRVAVCIAGRVEQEAPPAVLFTRPRSVEVARLVGFRTFLRATPLADGAMMTECGRLTVAAPAAEAGRAPSTEGGRVPTSSLQDGVRSMPEPSPNMNERSPSDRSVPAPTVSPTTSPSRTSVSGSDPQSEIGNPQSPVVGLRPEQCVASTSGSCLGRVIDFRYLGGRAVSRVRVGSAVVEVTSTLDPAPGSEIRFGILGDAVPLDGSPGDAG